jgi:hypothetical protein
MLFLQNSLVSNIIKEIIVFKNKKFKLKEVDV